MVWRRGGNHDQGGDAAEAGKRQAFDQFLVGHDFVCSRLQLAVDAPDPERMPERHRFASRPRQAQLPRVGAAPADSTGIESLSRYPPAFVANRLFASLGTQPSIRRLRRTGNTVRLLGPNSHDFLLIPR